jgi:hypothetical protein
MAAGLGFKTFTTGEVLTAADVNGYLMQGVLVFASEAARNAAITSPQEGQFAFTKDNNSLWYYTGSAWAASGATGDIEGVTAGVGISGGGTSGTVTITNDMATTITASGDIVVGTGSGTYDNLPIGSTGQVLTADTTVSPYKVKWAAPAAGGFVGASIYNNASQAISNTTWTTLNFNSEVFDTDTFHDTSTNNSRITIPSGKNGKYLITAKWHFQGNASGSDRLGAFKKNGTAIGSYRGINGNASSVGWGASVILDLVATDYIELEVYQDSGGNLNALGGFAAPEYNFLQVQFLGA